MPLRAWDTEPVIRQQFAVSFTYPVVFTRDLFSPDNRVLADLLKDAPLGKSRALVVIDSQVADHSAGLLEKIRHYGDQHADVLEFVAPPIVVPGGEACKNDPQLVERLHAAVERTALCRHSYIIVIGGGAVLDAAGYAAATAHRGIRLIRVPTTVLAQNDAGVGVKNSVNAFGRKNFLGTFCPPFAVLNDFSFLETLPERDLRAGIAEAVKVALIRDREFFDTLYRQRSELKIFSPAAMEQMIVRCAELHLAHIATAGDPFESGSSRPLDFGHWNAHKLEELTGGQLRHGEAVAIGMALDALYSWRSGLLSKFELHRIRTLLEEIGFELYHPSLAWVDVSSALEQFREHLGGELCIPLLDGIGSKRDICQIDAALMKECVSLLAERGSAKNALETIDEISTNAKEN